MNYKNVSKIVGREITAENLNTITAAEFAMINAKVPTAQSPEATNAPAATAPEATNAPATTSPEATTPEATANTGVTAEQIQGIVDESLAPIMNRLDLLEKKPAAAATASPLVTGEQKPVHAWDDPENSINKALDERLG